MIYTELGPIKQVSKIALGASRYREQRAAQDMISRFVERGGNAVDTGHIYGDGGSERAIGRWLSQNPLSPPLIIMSKIGHPPLDDPRDFHRQLTLTCRRLGVEQVDIVLAHRDNSELPVEDVVGELDRLCQSGQARAFGLSNWSLRRYQGAMAQGAAYGPVACSNQFSLAQPRKAPYDGSVVSNTEDWRAWLSATQHPLLGWSSLSRGYFSERQSPTYRETWASSVNEARRDRARELSHELEVNMSALALAWNLLQPIKLVSVIGPESLKELDESMHALHVRLSRLQLSWLESGSRSNDSMH